MVGLYKNTCILWGIWIFGMKKRRKGSVGVFDMDLRIQTQTPGPGFRRIDGQKNPKSPCQRIIIGEIPKS